MNPGKIKDSTRIAEKAVVGSVSKTIYTMMLAQAPFLGWPIIKTIVEFTLEHFLYWASENGIIWFNVVWLRIEIGADASKLEKARQKAILAMDGTVMDKELDNIDKELRDAFDDLHRGNRNPL